MQLYYFIDFYFKCDENKLIHFTKTCKYEVKMDSCQPNCCITMDSMELHNCL
jgi:hypothetical protein